MTSLVWQEDTLTGQTKISAPLRCGFHAPTSPLPNVIGPLFIWCHAVALAPGGGRPRAGDALLLRLSLLTSPFNRLGGADSAHCNTRHHPDAAACPCRHPPAPACIHASFFIPHTDTDGWLCHSWRPPSRRGWLPFSAILSTARIAVFTTTTARVRRASPSPPNLHFWTTTFLPTYAIISPTLTRTCLVTYLLPSMPQGA